LPYHNANAETPVFGERPNFVWSNPMSGPAIVASFITVSFGLVTLAWAAAHAVDVRAIAKNRGQQ
jgi:hypothetical protein